MPNKKIEHIAIIPARKNSIGYPKKNRIFFSYTNNFLNKIKWFDKIYISTDDNWFKKYLDNERYEFIKRSKKLSGHTIPIKDVMEDAVKKKKINSNSIIWLIYIPLIPKSKKLFEKTKKIIEKKNVKSACGFTKVKTHPFLTWYTKKNKLYQFCKNNIYRRQDLPRALTHNHVVCTFKCNELKKLNNELINSKTIPMLINSEIKEID